MALGELATCCPRCDHKITVSLEGLASVHLNLTRHELAITVHPVVISHQCPPPGRPFANGATLR